MLKVVEARERFPVIIMPSEHRKSVSIQAFVASIIVLHRSISSQKKVHSKKESSSLMPRRES